MTLDRRDLLLFLACALIAFAATRGLDAVAADCHRTYDPNPPYPFEADYPLVDPEGAITSGGEPVEDQAPSSLDAWLPPLVPDPASWRLEGSVGEAEVMVLTLRASP